MVNGTCSYDEYLSSIYTIGISVVTRENIASRQNMPCPAVSAVTYSRDGSLGMLQEDKMVSLHFQISYPRSESKSVLGDSKMSPHLLDCGIKVIRPIFKTK